jgi:hypothetical protein
MTIKKNTIKPVLLKYRIKSILIDLYGKNSVLVRDSLINEIGISYETYCNDSNIEKSDTKEIPKTRQIAYAIFLGVEIKKLLY